jgi:hypothetical protein
VQSYETVRRLGRTGRKGPQRAPRTMMAGPRQAAPETHTRRARGARPAWWRRNNAAETSRRCAGQQNPGPKCRKNGDWARRLEGTASWSHPAVAGAAARATGTPLGAKCSLVAAHLRCRREPGHGCR